MLPADAAFAAPAAKNARPICAGKTGHGGVQPL